MDQFGIVRTISKTTNGSGQSGDFVNMTNSEMRTGENRNTGQSNAAFERLKRSLETFLTRLSRTNERSEKSRRVFRKPRCYKDQFDVCIDTWIEVMKLHFEEEDLSERQE